MQIRSKQKKQTASISKDPQLKKVEKRRRMEFQGKTDKGRVRTNNEDAFGFKMPEVKEKIQKYGSLFIVADGVGGNANGEIASQMAVAIVSNMYYTQPETMSVEARLQIAFEKANQTIRLKAHEIETPDMATTATVAVVFPDRAVIANIGDSRAYVINPNRTKPITQITHDHSLVAEQVREGMITAQQAKVAKNKNVITRALGIDSKAKVDYFNLPIAPGDKILLTTDGLLRVLNDEQIYQVVQSKSTVNPVDTLIDLANKGGAPDNVTVCVIDMDKKAAFIKRNPILSMGVVLLSLLIIGSYIFFTRKAINNLFPQHRLTISTLYPATIQEMKLIPNTTDQNTGETQELDLLQQLDIRNLQNGKRFNIYKYSEKKFNEKNTENDKKNAFDFKNGDQVSLTIQDKESQFEPVKITLVYSIDDKDKPAWEIKTSRSAYDLTNAVKITQEPVGKNTQNVLDLQDNQIWVCPQYLRIHAPNASKVEFIYKKMTIFAHEFITEGEGAFSTLFERNDNLESVKQTAIETILANSSEKESQITCRLTFHGDDKPIDYILLYKGRGKNSHHIWSFDKDPSDKHNFDYKKDKENKSELFPTLTIEHVMTGKVVFTITSDDYKIISGKLIINKIEYSIAYGKVEVPSLPYGSCSYVIEEAKDSNGVDCQNKEGSFTLKETQKEVSVTLKRKGTPPPPPPPSKQGTVTFKVTADSQPVENAKVTITGIAGSVHLTDSSGKVTFQKVPYGTYTYSVSHKDYNPINNASFTLGETQKEVSVTLKRKGTPPPPPPPSKQGTVTFKVTADSQPVGNAKVTITGIAGSVHLTDSSGKVTFQKVPYGTYTYSVSHKEYNSIDNASFTLGETQKEVSVTLTKKTGTVTFTVMADGQPVGNAKVTITGIAGSLNLTDSSGKVTFQKVPYGTYTYSVSHKEYNSIDNASFTLGETQKEVSVTLTKKTGTVTFTVMADGQPVGNAKVTITGIPGSVHLTNSSGKVTFQDVPYGTYTYSVSHKDYEPINASFTLKETQKEVSVTLTRKTTLFSFLFPSLIYQEVCQ